MLAVDHAEGVGRGEGLGHPLLRPARAGRRLAVGEIDDPDPCPSGRQERERAATPDLDIIGMGPDGDHVERPGFPPGVARIEVPCGSTGTAGRWEWSE
jgi:hypothetical protein